MNPISTSHMLPTKFDVCQLYTITAIRWQKVSMSLSLSKIEHQITVCDGWRTKLNAGIRTLSTNSFQCYRLPALIEPTQHSFHICFSISNSHSPSHPAQHSTQKQQQFKQKPPEYFFPIFHTLFIIYSHPNRLLFAVRIDGTIHEGIKDECRTWKSIRITTLLKPCLTWILDNFVKLISHYTHRILLLNAESRYFMVDDWVLRMEMVEIIDDIGKPNQVFLR